MPTFKHPCPHCAKYIARDVPSCPFCATEKPFSTPPKATAAAQPVQAAQPAQPTPTSTASRKCSGCGAPLAAGARFCTVCGTLTA